MNYLTLSIFIFNSNRPASRPTFTPGEYPISGQHPESLPSPQPSTTAPSLKQTVAPPPTKSPSSETAKPPERRPDCENSPENPRQARRQDLVVREAGDAQKTPGCHGQRPPEVAGRLAHPAPSPAVVKETVAVDGGEEGAVEARHPSETTFRQQGNIFVF